jgi:hypothetical protein
MSSPFATHEKHEYREDCEGCQVTIFDPVSRATLPKDHPVMAAALRLWWARPIEVRRAINRVWAHGSRAPADVEAQNRFAEEMQAEALALTSPRGNA